MQETLFANVEFEWLCFRVAAQMGKQLGLVRTGVRTERALVELPTPTCAVDLCHVQLQFARLNASKLALGGLMRFLLSVAIQYVSKQFTVAGKRFEQISHLCACPF